MLVAATNPCPCGFAGSRATAAAAARPTSPPPAPAERAAARPHGPARRRRRGRPSTSSRAAADTSSARARERVAGGARAPARAAGRDAARLQRRDGRARWSARHVQLDERRRAGARPRLRASARSARAAATGCCASRDDRRPRAATSGSAHDDVLHRAGAAPASGRERWRHDVRACDALRPRRASAACGGLAARAAGRPHRARAAHGSRAVLALADDELIAALGGAGGEAHRAASCERFDADAARARCAAAGVELRLPLRPGVPAPAARARRRRRRCSTSPAGSSGCSALVGARPGRDRRRAAGVAVRARAWRARSARGLAARRRHGRQRHGARDRLRRPRRRARRRRRRRSRCCPRPPTGPTRRASARCTGGSPRPGAVVSELPPGTGARRWMFPARNRIIAGARRR